MSLTQLAFLTVGIALSISDFANATAPHTETFNTDNANWRQASSSAPAIYTTPSGGPDGSPYISSDYAFQSATMETSVIHRANDNVNASGDAFVGNWLAAGINNVTAYVRHNVPQEMHYSLRLAQSNSMGIPVGAISFELPHAVQPNVWTKLDFDVSYSNPLHTNESTDNSEAWFNGILSSITNLQISIDIVPPGDLVNGTTYAATYRYDVDNVSTSVVPEPSSLMLLCAGVAGIGMPRRRKS